MDFGLRAFELEEFGKDQHLRSMRAIQTSHLSRTDSTVKTSLHYRINEQFTLFDCTDVNALGS